MNILYTGAFENWLKKLRDQRAKAAIVSRIERMEDGNFGDYRSVGGGVSELRINVGKGYRAYYTIRRNTEAILLCGGDKASQQQDIKLAQQLASTL